MGVCGSKDNSSLDRPGQGILTLWGDYFSPETRTILVMLQIGGVKHDFQQVDQFKGEHRKEQYLSVNPTGALPTITEGRFLILGGYLVFLTYLANHHKSIREKLYPQEEKIQVDKLMLWFQSIMRVCTSKIARMIVGPQAFGERAPTQEEMKTQDDEFYDHILPVLEKRLLKTEFVCGEDYTVADILFYNELVTVLVLKNKELSQEDFPNLNTWFKKIGSIPEVMDSEKKLREIVNKYNFV